MLVKSAIICAALLVGGSFARGTVATWQTAREEAKVTRESSQRNLASAAPESPSKRAN